MKKLVCDPLSVNTYIIHEDNGKDCVVIDPGVAEPVLTYLRNMHLRCSHLLLTHGHYDHVLGVAALQKSTGAKVFIHREDDGYLHSGDVPRIVYDGYVMESCTPDGFVDDGDILYAAGLELRVIHVPGHTLGSVCYLIEKARMIFTGDTIFHQDAGRADSQKSSYAMLYGSIVNKLFTLQGEYTLYPGHMEEGSLEEERRNNPFVRYWRRIQE